MQNINASKAESYFDSAQGADEGKRSRATLTEQRHSAEAKEPMQRCIYVWMQIASLIAHHLTNYVCVIEISPLPIWGEVKWPPFLRRHFICCPVAMNPARIIVDPVFYPFQFFGGQSGYIYTFGNKPPEYPVAILIAPALPAAVWVGVIDFAAFRCLLD